jgi:hypothetical protein
MMGELKRARKRRDSLGWFTPSNAAVGVDLHPQRLDVICAISTPCEIRKVELDLIPAFIQSHRHGADERLDARCGLII